MKRYFSGVRMLEDLASERVLTQEKLIFLIFIFLPAGKVIDYIFPTAPVPLSGSSETVGYFVSLIGLLLFYVVNRSIDNRNLIERYCCLFIPATITSYIFLIPILVLSDKLIKNILNQPVNETTLDYLIVSYISCYILISAYFWNKKAS